MYNKDSSARTEQKPLKPIRQHAVWLLLAFFLALSFFATRNLLERFDSLQDDGGVHYFQYHGRYTVDYADWTSAIMIAT